MRKLRALRNKRKSKPQNNKVTKPPAPAAASCTMSVPEDISNILESGSSEASSLLGISDLDVEVSDGDHFSDVRESDYHDYENISNEDEPEKSNHDKKTFKRKREKNIDEESEYSWDENQMNPIDVLKTPKSWWSDRNIDLREEKKLLKALLNDFKEQSSAIQGIPDLLTAMKDLVSEVKQTKIEVANIRNEISSSQLKETSLKQTIENVFNSFSQQTAQLSTNINNTNQHVLTLKDSFENFQKALPHLSVPEKIVREDFNLTAANVNSQQQEPPNAHCAVTMLPPPKNSLETVDQEGIADPIVLSDTEEILSSEEDGAHQRSPSPISISDESEDSETSISHKSASTPSPSYNSGTESLQSIFVEENSPVKSRGLFNSSNQNQALAADESPLCTKVSTSHSGTNLQVSPSAKQLKLPDSSELYKYIGDYFDFGSVRLPRQRLKELSYEKVSVLVSELCVNVFTPTEMALSNLSGRRSNTHKNSILKRPLDPGRINGIVDFIFKLTNSSNRLHIQREVRQAITVKLGNFAKTDEGKKIIADQQAQIASDQQNSITK